MAVHRTPPVVERISLDMILMTSRILSLCVIRSFHPKGNSAPPTKILVRAPAVTTQTPMIFTPNPGPRIATTTIPPRIKMHQPSTSTMDDVWNRPIAVKVPAPPAVTPQTPTTTRQTPQPLKDPMSARALLGIWEQPSARNVAQPIINPTPAASTSTSMPTRRWESMMLPRVQDEAVAGGKVTSPYFSQLSSWAAEQSAIPTFPVVATTVLAPPSPRLSLRQEPFRKVPFRKRPSVDPVVTKVPGKIIKGAVDPAGHKTPCGGWLTSRVSPVRRPHRKYVCDLCKSSIDSMENLRQHRGSRPCRALQDPLTFEILSPPVDPEPYIIRRRHRHRVDLDETIESAGSSQREVILLSSDDETAIGDDASFGIEQPIVPTVSLLHNASVDAVSDDPAISNEFECRLCKTIFNTLIALRAHRDSDHLNDLPEKEGVSDKASKFKCGQCETDFNALKALRIHRTKCHPDDVPNGRVMCDGFECSGCSLSSPESIMNDVFRSVLITPSMQSITSDQFILYTRSGIIHVLQHCLANGDSIKVHTAIEVTMQKVNLEDGTVDMEKPFYFLTKATPIQCNTDIEDFINHIQAKLEKEIDKFTNQVSNWIVASINYVKLSVVKYHAFRGGASNFVVPPELAAKKCVINIEAERQECFKYAVVASLHFEEVINHRHRKIKYDNLIQRYDFSNIDFPATANDIVEFQKNNVGITINALEYVSAKGDRAARVKVIYHAPHSLVRDRRIATILLVKDHWLAVTNLNRLLSTQRDDGVRDNVAFCYRCLQNLLYPDRLERHMVKCYSRVGQRVVLPAPEDAVHQFKDWSKMLSPPFVMYADIECILVKPDQDGKVLQTHVPCAVGSYLVAHKALNRVQQPVKINKGIDCIGDFCEELDGLVHEIYNFNQLQCKKPQRKTLESETVFAAATCCEYCKVVFGDAVQKVWHHDHISGDFIAALCQPCNTKIRQSLTSLPVIIHNLRNYDMHALCLQGFSQMRHWELKPIAQTKEKYITLTAHTSVGEDEKGNRIMFEIRFVDSYQFLTASLDKLSSSLPHIDMKHVQFFRQSLDGQVDDDVIFSKGVFPYSYLDHWDKLRELNLPALPAFFDTLSNSMRTTPAEYDRAQKAFQQFKCSNFADYLYRYLELDCYLLADVFENFRSRIIVDTGLDPVNFITLPQFTFSAAFRHSQCDLLTDVEMYEFFEDGIRGGMSFVNTHYVKADENTSISYWDENNLYGNSLSDLLPTSHFHWVSEAEIATLDWQTIATEGNTGYVLKVDLQYPAEIHDKTQDFPLAPEAARVTEDMFTPYMQECWTRRCEFRSGSSKFKPETKLLMSCVDKKEYVVHFKLLKFYLEMGMKITKIHSVIAFKQSALFKNYIDSNSAKRQSATDDFTKDLYKLLNNALFGKTMENVRGRKDFKLRTSEAQMLLDTSKARFLRTHKFSNNLLLNELTNMEVKLNKPIFIGQAVLDLSKLLMYELRYVKLKSYERRFGGKITVIGGDTDSLFCKIESIDLFGQLYPAMLRDELLDSSNYPPDHVLFSERMKARLGCIKDEVRGEMLVEAVLLKPKCYSMKTASGKENKKRAKGIQYCVKERISHESYVQCFKLQEELVRNTRRFETNNHVVSTIQQNKWALSAFDTKRAWVTANESLPYGHFRLVGGIGGGSGGTATVDAAAGGSGEPAAKRPRFTIQ